MKTKQPKLTLTERRAKAFCAQLNANDGGNINVEWKRSHVWGYNPSITSYEGKCTNVSGCGYDKLSTALAVCLRFLFPEESEAHHAIWRTGGAGESSTRDALAAHGWTLEKTASGSTFDAYKLSRKA